jgi:hypothetical protein
MSKQLLTIDDLTSRVLAKIREDKGGRDVSEISIYEIAGDRSNQNWGVSIVEAGSGGMAEASRAAVSAMVELGKRYDLSSDE